MLGLGVAIVAWFLTSALCTACAKLALQRLAPHDCALTLTALQFALSALIGAVAARARGHRVPSARREVLFVSVAYTCGFLFLNLSLGRLHASFAETVRGLEPLTSFALARLLSARGSRPGPVAQLALAGLICGALLSVAAQPVFDARGLAFGLAANACFSARALLVTSLQDATRRRAAESGDPSLGEIDSLGLFAAQHFAGLVALVPAALAADSHRCLDSLAWPSAAANPHAGASGAAALSAVAFGSYNLLSLVVLLLIDAVSHAVCNTLRRAVTIGTAALVFRNAIPPASAAGIVLIIGSAAVYSYAFRAERHLPAEGGPAIAAAAAESHKGLLAREAEHPPTADGGHSSDDDAGEGAARPAERP
jgi:hypothetical protein